MALDRVVSYRLICSRCTCVVLLKMLFRLVLVVILVICILLYADDIGPIMVSSEMFVERVC